MVAYSTVRLNIRPTLDFDGPDQAKLKLNLNSVDYIRDKYFSKLAPEDFRQERHRILETKRLRSIVPNTQPRTPKISVKETDARIALARVCQNKKMEQNRILSAFYTEKTDVQNSIRELALSLRSNRQVQGGVKTTWVAAVTTLNFLMRLGSQVMALRKFSQQTPSEVKLIFFALTKLKSGVAPQYKRTLENASKMALTIVDVHTSLSIEGCRADARAQVLAFLVALSSRAALDSKVKPMKRLCGLTRPPPQIVCPKIHPKFQGLQTQSPKSTIRGTRGSDA